MLTSTRTVSWSASISTRPPTVWTSPHSKPSRCRCTLCVPRRSARPVERQTMNAMSHRGYLARIEFDAGQRIFVGHIDGINDVVGFHGETVVDLETAFQTAVDDFIEACAKIGKLPEKPYRATRALTP